MKMKTVTNEIEDRKRETEKETGEENMHVHELFKCLIKILL